MTNYKNILLALELNPKTDVRLIKEAQEIAKITGANITLIHAIEYISGFGIAYGVAIAPEVEVTLTENAKKEMIKIGNKMGIPEEKQVIKHGPAKFIILDEAENLKADLIVVGSHGRQGLRMILGSTANAVLHGAKCDVLVVRLKD
jgi:universal stress protein A